MKIVLQGDNQCWAATAAMNINYLKGTALTAYNVAYRIYPSNPYQAATNTMTVYVYSFGIRTTVELNSSGNFSCSGYTWRDSIVLS